MDVNSIVGILHELVQGLDCLTEAIQIALLHYEDKAYDETFSMSERSERNE